LRCFQLLDRPFTLEGVENRLGKRYNVMLVMLKRLALMEER
jgi:hypothetical protein